MTYRAAVRISSDPMTAAGDFEPTTIDSETGSGLTIDIKSATLGGEQPKKIWVNLALASILTLTPVNILGPIDIFGRRRGTASATIYDWLELEEDMEDGLLFPGGLIIPNPERKILFQKVLRLEGLEKRKPYLNF